MYKFILLSISGSFFCLEGMEASKSLKRHKSCEFRPIVNEAEISVRPETMLGIEPEEYIAYLAIQNKQGNNFSVLLNHLRELNKERYRLSQASRNKLDRLEKTFAARTEYVTHATSTLVFPGYVATSADTSNFSMDATYLDFSWNARY